jgi:hypothetical protein
VVNGEEAEGVKVCCARAEGEGGMVLELVAMSLAGEEEEEEAVALLSKSLVVWKSQSVEEVPSFDSRKGIAEEGSAELLVRSKLTWPLLLLRGVEELVESL